MKLEKFFLTLKENRSWLILAIFFFIGGFILTYLSLSQDPEFFTFIEETFQTVLAELEDEVIDISPLQMFFFYFTRNLTAILYISFLGIVLGIPSLFSAIVNGSVLGLLTFQLSRQGVATVPFLLAGIVPHGIFEFPAFFLSVALGLKLGYHVVFPLPNLSRGHTLRKIFGEVFSSLPYIVVLIALAALVEAFITPLFLASYF
ncbi:MAG: stage II sporulation protein M [Firmicutes bacterium]|nr:stage II sporulation protein M [Bacillota bacterium]